MRFFLTSLCLLLAPAAGEPTRAAAASAAPPLHAAAGPQHFTVEPKSSHYAAQRGESRAVLTFTVRNTSAAEMVVTGVRTTCGCSTAKLPSTPWRLPPHASGEFEIEVDLRGRTGTLTRFAAVDTATESATVTFSVNIPGDPDPLSAAKRARNQEFAGTDRQAVFKGECAGCHVAPTIDLRGAALYATACGICHEAEHRATMVPDLAALSRPADADYWRLIITRGKPGTLMPAFAREEGGPLDADQVDSLAAYLTQIYPPGPPPPPPPSSRK